MYATLSLDAIHASLLVLFTRQKRFRKKTCLPMHVIALANKAVKKPVVDNGFGKKHSQYFILMVASDAVSSFVLFHVKVWASGMTLHVQV